MEVPGAFKVLFVLVVMTGAMYMILYENQDRVYQLLGLRQYHHRDADLQVSYKYRQRSHPKRTYLYEHPNKNVKTYVKEESDPPQRKLSYGRKVKNKALGMKKRNGKHQSLGTNSASNTSSSASSVTLGLDSVQSMGDVVNFFQDKSKEEVPKRKSGMEDVGFDEEEKYDPPHIVDVVDEFGLSVKATADE